MSLNGRRGGFLITYAMACIFIGLGYVAFPESASRRDTFAWLPGWIPLQWLAGFWWTAAVMAAWSAFRHAPKSDRAGFAALTFVLILWAGSFLTGWVVDATRGGWVSAATYATFAVLVLLVSRWPNPAAPPDPPSLLAEPHRG